MEYITITAESYEKAVADAREKYGSRVRIISRRDYTVGGGLFAKKRNRSEIVCYLTDGKEEAEPAKATGSELLEFEKEARTPDPDTLTAEEKRRTVLTEPGEDEKALKEAGRLLDLNEITDPLREQLLIDFVPGDDLAISLGDRIISKVDIDYASQAHPKKYMVLLGPTGSGKTTTMAKIASLYKSVGRSVAILTLDSYRVGAYEQAKAFAEALSIPVELARGEDEVLLARERFANKDLVLVDTMGISPEDGALNLRLKGLLSQLDEKETMYVLVSAANLKCSDLMKQYRRYKEYSISSLIVTKLDETESIGSFLTFSYITGRPMLFCTNGQHVPQDIRKISTTVILEYLTGFGIDIKRIAAQLS